MENFTWIVCYIDVSQIDSIESDLARKYRIYLNVEAYIPTIRILSKTFKKKDTYKEVPLLMNYGFFKVPKYFIYNDEVLRTFKRDIKAIFHFVHDASKEKLRKKKKRKIPTIAQATNDEIKALIEVCKTYDIYSEDELKTLKVGQAITLRTYPFEGVMVEVMELDHKRRKAKVKLLEGVSITPYITIAYEHLVYTIYHGDHLVNSPRERSLDEMLENGNSIDNLISNEANPF